MKNDQNDKPLVTISEAAKMLGLSVYQVRHYADQGLLTTYRAFGRGLRRFNREEVLAMKALQVVPAKNE
jgi:excisionase family DNA binding protein